MTSLGRLTLSISLFSFFHTLLLPCCLKTKSKDAKDKEKLSRHQFVPGTFSGVLQCLVCDKTLLGKESFQCSSKLYGLMCVALCFASPDSKTPEKRAIDKHSHIDFSFNAVHMI